MLVEILVSLTWTNLFMLVLTSYMVYFWWYQQSRKGLPPFPATPFPFLGNILHTGFTINFVPLIRQWRKKHGDLLSLYLGTKLFIFVSGYDAIRETFVTFADLTSERPHMCSYRKHEDQQAGVSIANGIQWKERRALFMNFLRSVQKGKNVFEEHGQAELAYTLHYFEKQNKEPVDPLNEITRSLLSLNCSFIFGRRFDPDGSDINEVITFNEDAKVLVPIIGLVNMYPILKHIPGDLFKIKALQKCDSDTHTFSQRQIQYKKENPCDEDCNCFIKAYWKECAKGSPSLNDKDLPWFIVELLHSGADNVIDGLYWWILNMSRYPDVQAKAFEEIKEHIGLTRLPTLEDKSKLKYINAVNLETFRAASLVPFAFPHEARETFKLRGYTIPKGAVLMPCIHSVLHDERIWGDDPFAFQPERLLDKDGNISPNEKNITFSVGKRSCPGELHAKTIMFYYSVSILQQFKILPVDPDTLSSVSSVPDTFYMTPMPYKVRFIRRNHQLVNNK